MWFPQDIDADWFDDRWIDTTVDIDELDKGQERDPYRLLTTEELVNETRDFFNTYY